MATMKTVTILLLHTTLVVGQVDLNAQEIQYVADHLTDQKCDELMDALHQKTFLIRTSHVKSVVAKPSADDDRPCIDRIKEWIKGPGRNLTYDYLALRLKEIGLGEVSDRLAQAVMRETTDELHQFFLDNPFKEMIPTKSLMIDKPEVSTKLVPIAAAEGDDYEKMFIIIIVLAALAAALCLPVTICVACPRAFHFVCERACPSFCSVSFDIMVDGCHRVWYGSKKTADKYLFVAPKQGGGGLMV
ncbi:hypothetical protein BsWGS_21760 [Bradybaena similaris]